MSGVVAKLEVPELTLCDNCEAVYKADGSAVSAPFLKKILQRTHPSINKIEFMNPLLNPHMKDLPCQNELGKCRWKIWDCQLTAELRLFIERLSEAEGNSKEQDSKVWSTIRDSIKIFQDFAEDSTEATQVYPVDRLLKLKQLYRLNVILKLFPNQHQKFFQRIADHFGQKDKSPIDLAKSVMTIFDKEINRVIVLHATLGKKDPSEYFECPVFPHPSLSSSVPILPLEYRKRKVKGSGLNF